MAAGRVEISASPDAIIATSTKRAADDGATRDMAFIDAHVAGDAAMSRSIMLEISASASWQQLAFVFAARMTFYFAMMAISLAFMMSIYTDMSRFEYVQ